MPGSTWGRLADLFGKLRCSERVEALSDLIRGHSKCFVEELTCLEGKPRAFPTTVAYVNSPSTASSCS
jgi:hypothetical protein